MLRFSHQTVFVLCIALVVMTGVSLVSVALLFMERQDIDLLQQRISSLRQENTLLKSQLGDVRNGLTAQQGSALAPLD